MCVAESLVALMLDDLSICYELHLTICTQMGVEFFLLQKNWVIFFG